MKRYFNNLIAKQEQQEQELKTVYDTRKSFYKKAKTKFYQFDNFNIITLKSYNSLVACVVIDNNTTNFFINDNIDNNFLFSQTTLRHIKEFYKQFYKNFDNLTKKFLFNAYLIDFNILTLSLYEKYNNN